MIRIAPIVVLIGILFAAGCSKQSSTVNAQQNAQAIRISTSQALVKTVPASFEETGTFNPDETSDVAPLVAGRVIATPVDVGDFVKQGQVICELDHRDAQLKLDQAKAQMDQAVFAVRQAQSRIGVTDGADFDVNKVPEVAAAKANYESAEAQARLAAADAKRYEGLVRTGDVSKSTYDKVRTQQETADAQVNAVKQQYEAALNLARQSYRGIEFSQASQEGVRSQLAQAQKALDDTTIRAPFDGYITARSVAAGEYVALTNKIATMVRVGLVKLQLQTPEQRAGQTRIGMTVVARVAAYPNREFTGRVTAINPSVDPNSRVFTVEARFENAKGELRPGMFATARVLLPGGEDAVFIPRQAVIRDKTTDSYQVFTVDGGKAHLRVVVPGDIVGEMIRINSGLSGKDSVAISNQGDLFDGAPVVTRS
ncbi:MAG: efflux RND transporter periplasmic adaptor subunit [Acidobacteriia bacterium]|nr:efflux RND transporter periplasmic adaptor subunit [Terriglobia bacterium]